MINSTNKAYMRAKAAIIQLRIEQLAEELTKPDGQVDKVSVRRFMTLIRQEAEDLEMHGMTNNKHKPGPRKDNFETELDLDDYFKDEI